MPTHLLGWNQSRQVAPGAQERRPKPFDAAQYARDRENADAEGFTIGGMTLDEICQNTRILSARHGWDLDDTAHRMLSVTSEVGEVADAVLVARRAAADGVPERLVSAKRAAAYEIYDAIWNLCALANALEVDLTAAAHEKAEANERRTWAQR